MFRRAVAAAFYWNLRRVDDRITGVWTMVRREYLLLLTLVLASCTNGTTTTSTRVESSVSASPTPTRTSALTATSLLATTTAIAATAIPPSTTATAPTPAPTIIPTTPTPTAIPPTRTPVQQAQKPTAQSPTPTPVPPAATASSSGCTLGVIENLSGESSAADAARTASWILQHESGWTVFTPGGDWHLTTSSQGLDALSPEGGSDASLASWPSLTPWTYQSLAANILSAVSNIQVICQSPSVSSSSGETQATEITGVYRGEAIHAVIVLSLLTPTTPGFYDGQTRSIYTPASQWSTDNETTLWLIVKRAILNPSGP